jgi:hypothetical protein
MTDPDRPPRRAETDLPERFPAVSSDRVESDVPATIQPGATPAAPVVASSEMYRGSPYLLVSFGQRHTIGWQDTRRAGQCFVVARITRLDGIKVLERFPLTDTGWVKAWRALTKLDKAGAQAAAEVLAKREVRDRARARFAQLDADSLASMRGVIFVGGYTPESELTQGKPYDLRFLADRLKICHAGTADATAELAYAEIDTVDLGGPGQIHRLTAGQQVGMTMAFGLPGAIAALADTKIQTTVRIHTADSEMFFMDSKKLADTWRVELSVPLKAIHDARGARDAEAATGDADRPEPGSVTDQLTRLASMLEQGLLTRVEFDQLKAKLIAEA